MNIGRQNSPKKENYSIFDINMRILSFILLPFSWLYGAIAGIRNLLFDFGLKPTIKVNAKVISIGNLSVGGTGKTPHVEYLANELSKTAATAILLRGYGRKTKGFLLVDENSKANEVGDEALYYYNVFGNQVKVIVCEKRVEGAQKLLSLFPKTEVILLDDAYQHRYIHRDINILLTEFNRPFYKDFVLPAGRLREFTIGKKRADVIIVTKTPTTVNKEQKEKIITKIQVSENQVLLFSHIEYGAWRNLANGEIKNKAKDIVLVTGIANPKPLLEHLEKFAKVTHLQFKDHYEFSVEDITKIHKIFDTFVSSDKIIMTTQKDAMRLLAPEIISAIKDYPWYSQEMEIKIENDNLLLNKIYGNNNSN